MITVYIDSENKCHPKNDGTMKPVKIDFPDGMCDAFIEGYCCEVKENGVYVYPWKPYEELDAIQREYERQLIKELQENSIPIAELAAAYQEGVNSV